MDLRYNVMMPDVRQAQVALEQRLVRGADEAEAAAAAMLAAAAAAAAATSASAARTTASGSGSGSGSGSAAMSAEAGLAAVASVAAAAAAHERARARLESFAVSAAEGATETWWALADALVARFSNGFQCLGPIEAMQEGDRLAPGYPRDWLIAAGFHNYPATHPPVLHIEGGSAATDGSNMAAAAGRAQQGGISSTDKGAFGYHLGRLSSSLPMDGASHDDSGRNAGWEGLLRSLRRVVSGLLRDVADWVAPA